ncbi:putative bifunctional diguanylate cyclase/phosphodiesterase [Aromatoleum anaerobium]|uniref:EAL domain-containing protein n=1 Tax=Aromatoleum anaerobium TaxID=182180 RepID=A0ABX1PM03_9RHOO|nr:EAL domain-containing protein [Aromatoleum anaerobium]MCK0508038.1 EAL domain-containing protein [Aromatoleum anaerobium]
MIVPPDAPSTDVESRESPAPSAVGELGRVNRALRTLSAGNRTLLRADDEETLLHAMCRVIVEQGGYRVAWVGYAQHDKQKSIQPMAYVGVEAGVLESTPLTWGESGLGLGPTGTAVRTGQAVIGRNILNDPALAHWRDEAIRHGHAAISVFPLRIGSEILGNLSITATDPDAFDEAEVRLLAELADDLAYGIANLRIRANHREAEKTIARMAYEDALTGLPNRLSLCECLHAAVGLARQRQRSLALLVIKVRGFREINDTLGYRQGDRLLQEISSRLAGLLKEGETLARVGDDEFALLLPGGGADYATQVAGRFVLALRQPVDLAGLMVDARASIGVAIFPGHGSDPDALIRRASMAAYQARRTAMGYALYAGSLDEDCTRRLTLMGELRRAITNDELRLYCQPKVDMASGRVCGAEALVRWQHPQAGLVSPGEFIKLAERAGLITPLTHWVLEAGFCQAYAWQESGLDRPLSINLSAQDLHDPSLLDRIRGLFATWGNRPELIQFELTESALMDDPAGALETLSRLKQMDVELFIDDYGTGYSSLSYLQKLPVDAIKIDQSFVMSMVASDDSAIIVRSTIELGHNLDLRVVAEGVENEAIWERLATLGCDTAQGYFIGMPIQAGEFSDWETHSRWRL